MKMKKIKGFLSILLTAALLLAGASAGAAAGEKVLTVATPYTVNTLLPDQYMSDGDRYIIGNIYEPLIEQDKGGYIPALAESWTIEDDNTYVFHLRQNAYWQTGNPLFGDTKVQVTAEDVKAVYSYLKSEDYPSFRKSYLGNLESFEIVDPFTIRLTTKEPDAKFLRYISDIEIFPMKAIAESFDLNQYPVGTGAFKFSEYRADDRVVLVKNEDYYIEPNLDKLIFKIIPDKAVAAIALRNGEVDIALQLLPTDLEAVAAESFLTVVPSPSGSYRYIGFNLDDPFLADLNVRLAIRKAIDFEAITNVIFKNAIGATLAIPAYGPVTPEFLGYNPDAWKAEYEFNPQKAVELLEAAGFVKGSDGVYQKDGKRLALSIKTPANDPNRMKMGDIAATYLKQIGMDAVTIPTEWGTLLSDISTGNVQMFVSGGGTTMDGLNYLFNSAYASANSHRTGLVDPELDSLLSQAFRTVDETARKAMLEEASLRAVRDCVHAGGYVEYAQIGVNTRVTGFSENTTTWYGFVTSTRNIGVSD